jgi:hypothetical protein
MTQEGTYLTLLKQAQTHNIEGDRLSLLDAYGATILSFVE